MTSRLTAYLTVALALIVAGCAGSNFSKQSGDTLVLGQTSRQEILQRLGSPYREGTVTKNGKQLKTMTYAFATTGGTPAREGVTPAFRVAFSTTFRYRPAPRCQGDAEILARSFRRPNR